DRCDRLAYDPLLVEQFVALLRDQHAVAVGNRQLLWLCAPAERLTKDVAEIEHAHRGARHARDLEGRQVRCGAFLHLDLDLALIERALAQHLAEFLARIGARIVPDERIKDAVLGRQLPFGSTSLRSRSRIIAIATS